MTYNNLSLFLLLLFFQILKQITQIEKHKQSFDEKQLTFESLSFPYNDLKRKRKGEG